MKKCKLEIENEQINQKSEHTIRNNKLTIKINK